MLAGVQYSSRKEVAVFEEQYCKYVGPAASGREMLEGIRIKWDCLANFLRRAKGKRNVSSGS